MRFHALRVGPLAGLALGFLLLPRAAAAQSTIAGLVTLPRWILFFDKCCQRGSVTNVTGPGSQRGIFDCGYAAL